MASTRAMWIRSVTLLSVVSLMLLGLPIRPPVADAATIPLSSIQAQVSNQHGTTGTDAANCIRYSPTTGAGSSTTSSAFVSAGQEALTAHGYPEGGNCPNRINSATQSAIGVTPSSTASVTDGVPFLLAQIKHYNNPVNAPAARFTGDLSIILGGFDNTPTINYSWSMWETPNEASPCAFPTGPNQNGCADQIIFDSQVPTQTLTRGGVSYRLIMNGFSPATGASCPTVQPANTGTQYLTAEQATNAACLYASLVQIRSLRIVKQVVGASGITPPAFAYTSTSSLDGSPWRAGAFTLAPTATTPASTTKELLQGDTVSVSEAKPAGDQWTLTGLTCVDGTGAAVPEASTNLAVGTVTLTNVGAPATISAGPITCTYTNTYTPKGTLTLQKTVNGGTAQPSAWTLTATGPTPISGVAGSTAVTAQRVNTGTYTLSEAGSPPGYVGGAWVCTGAASQTATTVTVADGQNVTCSIVNRYATGQFRITKAVSGPNGGYAGSATSAFTGTYTCGTAAPVPFSVSTGTAYTSPAIQAGTRCTVTETQPTAYLTNSSWTWNTPTYPNGNQVVIGDGTTGVVGITNTYAQQTGTLVINKVIAPRAGVSAAGYTGDGPRAFTANFLCTIGGTVVASGSATTTPATPAQVAVPATSSCVVTEDSVTTQPGDFLDPSFSWDGATLPASVTVVQGQSVNSTITNWFKQDFATLTVTKQVSGAGYIGTGTPFRVTWDCGIARGSFDLAATGAAASGTAQIPARTLCSVVETAPSNALLDAGHVWGAPTYTGLTDGYVNLPANGSGTVTVTNPTVAIYGQLSVAKAIDTPANAALVRGLARFDLTVTCTAPAQGQTSNYTQTFSVPVGPASVTPPLPVGTSCSVSEAAPDPALLPDASYAWGAPSTSPAGTVTITRDTVTPVTVTNTVVRVYGSLAIDKIVTPLDGLDGAATTFSGTWTCTYGGGGANNTYTGTWSRVGAGPATLTGPSSQVPLTSSCSMTEDLRSPSRPDPARPSYRWGAPLISGPIQLTAADPEGQLTVTNPVIRVTGSFAIGKVVRGGVVGTAFAAGDFTFHYRCVSTDGLTVVEGDLGTGDGGTVSGPSVPADSTCTVSETGKPAAVNPYAWGASTFQTSSGGSETAPNDPVTFILPDDGSAVLVRAYNDIAPVRISGFITKQVTGATQGFTGAATSPFQISLVCTLGGVQTSYGPVDVVSGARVEVPGILMGSTCGPREGAIPVGYGLADSSYRWDRTPTLSPAQDVTDPNATYDFSVTNNIVRVRTTLALTKVVQDPGGVVASGFPFSGGWTCTHNGDPDVTGTWSVNGAGTATLTGVPADGILVGSTCTPTEGALGAPSPTDPSYYWGDPQLTAATTADGVTGTMQVTNTVQRRVGQLTVAKTVSGATAGYTSTGTDFSVGYVCYLADPGQGLKGEVNVAAGAAPIVLADNIPVGWTCQVAETTPSPDLLRDVSYVWGTPVLGGTTDGVLTVAATNAIVVDNPITRQTGTIEVVKAITTAVPAGTVLPTATFSGSYTCTYAAGTPAEETFTGTWQVTGSGVATLTPATGSPPAASMPETTSCTVTEDTPTGGLVDSSWAWGAPTLPAAVTVGGPEVPPVQAVVTNNPVRVHSTLSVTKAYTGVAGALKDGTTVAGSWKCLDGDVQAGAGRWTLPASGGTTVLFAADGSVLDADGAPILIPALANCQVTEDTPDPGNLVDGSYQWNSRVYTPADGYVVTDAAEPRDVTVTNSTSRVYGSFQVRKAIDGPGGYTTPSIFKGTWTCTRAGEPDVTGPWQVTDQGSVTVNGVLVGSTCAVTSEDIPTTQPVANDPSYEWGGHTMSEPVLVIAGVEQAPVITVTNATVRDLTHVEITKALTGDTAAAPSGAVYPMSYRCVSASGEEFTGSKTIAAGAVWVSPSDIPTGSTCTVTEGDTPSVTPRAVWGPTTMAVAMTDQNSPAPPPVVETTGKSVEFTVPSGNADRVIVVPKVTVTNSLVRQEAGWLAFKTSDPGSGTMVKPGQTITYTLTVQPTGPGVTTGVVLTDDLSQVLPYATVGALTPGQGTASVSGTTLTWDVGTISGTDPITLTYEGVVKADAFGATIKNAVTATGETPPSPCVGLIADGCPSSTEHPVIPGWTLTKGSVPTPGATVHPGDTITYAVTVTNLSAVAALPAGVVVTDNLTKVLSGATWVDVVAPVPGQATVAGTTLTWTLPEVPASGSVVLRYAVKVTDAGVGTTLENLVVGQGPPGAETPSPCPTCVTVVKHPVTAPVVPPVPPVPPAPPVPWAPPLAFTGVGIAFWYAVSGGLALVLLGGLFILSSRRHRGAHEA